MSLHALGDVLNFVFRCLRAPKGFLVRYGSKFSCKCFAGPTRQYNFDTIVLEPTGKHLATVVWLHGFSDSGARYLPCPHVTPSCANPSSQEFHQILMTFRFIQCMFYVSIHNLGNSVMCTDKFELGGCRWATELRNVNQLSPNVRRLSYPFGGNLL